MKIKKGDNVIVVSGKDRGKTGTVLKSFPSQNRVLVEGVNQKTVHQKAGQNIQKGQKVHKPAPIHVSNVMILDPKTKKPTRIKMTLEKGKKIRLTAKSGSKI